MHTHDDCSAAGENLDLISPLKYDNRQFSKQNGKVRKIRKIKERRKIKENEGNLFRTFEKLRKSLNLRKNHIHA